MLQFNEAKKSIIAFEDVDTTLPVVARDGFNDLMRHAVTAQNPS